MIGALMALQFFQMQEEARRTAQENYDAMQRAREQTADSLALYEAIKRADYGRDAIDVEAREVSEVPLIEMDKPE